MVFLTFFNLTRNFSIRSWWSEPQLAPGLAFPDCIELLHGDFGIDHLVPSLCWVVSCVVGRECLLWIVHSLCRTLLAFAQLHFGLQDQTCLLFQVSLDCLFLHSRPLRLKGHLFLVLALVNGVRPASVLGLVGLHRTVQLQFLWH